MLKSHLSSFEQAALCCSSAQRCSYDEVETEREREGGRRERERERRRKKRERERVREKKEREREGERRERERERRRKKRERVMSRLGVCASVNIIFRFSEIQFGMQRHSIHSGDR